mgnify:FL=1
MEMNKNKMTTCKVCGKEIALDAKVCPGCGAKNKKPIYKKIWFWLIIILFLIGMSGIKPNNSVDANKYEKNKKVTVTVVDMKNMTEADIDKWASDNKINIVRKEEYSDLVTKGNFISQSIEANNNVYEGDKITVVYSLGKEPTVGQRNALKKAESYSGMMNMSKKAIYNQLTSHIEGFTKEEAQYAVDNIKANWNENALGKAKSYSGMMSMSKKAIYNQLTSQVEGFTKEEAQYAIDHLEN